MLGHLIRKEILDHILSLRFLILSGIGALVIWLSLYSSYSYYQERLSDYRLAQAATFANYATIAPPIEIAGESLAAARSPNSFAAVASAIAAVFPESFSWP